LRVELIYVAGDKQGNGWGLGFHLGKLSASVHIHEHCCA